jgi:hypothetical protein
MTRHLFADECYSEIGAELASIGFRRRSRGIFTLQISADVFGWIGFNRVRQTVTSLELYPVIGVIHSKINELILSPRAKIKAELHPTISEPLSYLSKEKKYRTWTWLLVPEEVSATGDLMRNIRECGMVFIDNFSELKSLFSAAMEAAENGPVPFTIDHERVVPAAMYLMGSYEQIPAVLDRNRELSERIGGDSDLELFAHNLMRRLE